MRVTEIEIVKKVVERAGGYRRLLKATPDNRGGVKVTLDERRLAAAINAVLAELNGNDGDETASPVR